METQGIVEAVRKDNHGLKLNDGQWYTSFNQNVNCRKGDEVKITYTDNTKDGRTYHNFDKVQVMKEAPKEDFEKAREAKDASQLTSYAKDLAIAIIGENKMSKEIRQTEINIIMKEATQAIAETYNQMKVLISGEKKEETPKDFMGARVKKEETL